MRSSIYTRIAVWFSASVIIAIAGFALIVSNVERGRIGGNFFQRVFLTHLAQARLTYEMRGPEGLRSYLDRMSAIAGRHALLDLSNRNVLTGVVEAVDERESRTASDDRYRLVVTGGPRPDLSSILPYFGLLLSVGVGIGLIFALGLARPLHEMRAAVGRFGLGDLSVRIHSPRRDEIGQVADAFDEMADRVQTLLNAEHRLIQDVAHELRTPLARLSLAIELHKNNPDREEMAGLLKKEVRRLGDLVNELLHMIQAEGDPAERRHEEVDVEALLRAVVEDCRMEATAKGSSIHMDWGGGATTNFRGDSELLRRAVENVLRNAVRHNGSGGPVEVRGSTNADGIEISIRDHGAGVPTEHLDSLFRPFFRVEADRGRGSGGVGLGLSIAERAVVLHRGKIWAENAEPGLRVRVSLPPS